MAQVPERTVVINGSGGGSGGMGMGIIVGVILVIVLVMGIGWLVMYGPAANMPEVNINPTVNIAAPDIKVPDTITVNPPANAPAP